MRRFILTAIAVLAAGAMSTVSAKASELWLTIDQVRAYDLKTPVSSIIIGNPAIADISVQSNEKILMYGKTPGLTNIYLFDENGNRLDNIRVRVKSPNGNMLVVHRGINRATYSCTERCELTPMLGDSGDVFDRVSAQAAAKISTATSAARAGQALD